MRSRRSSARLRVAASTLAIVMAGCSSPPRRQAPQPVSLPDLSRASATVQEQLREAHSALTRQLENPRTPPTELAAAYGEMGKLLMAAEFGKAAEPCLLNAQMLAPGDMRWPYYLGHLYKDQGAAAQSTASFEQALRLRPDDMATLIRLGEAHLAQDRLDAAESNFARARSLQPGSVAALAGIGRVALARRDYRRAVQYLEEALGVDGQAGLLHYSLAMAYRGLGDLAKAETQLQQSGKNEIPVPDPLMQELRGLLRSAASFESTGIQALERGDSAAAAMYFRKGLELAPDNASLHHRLGTALFLAGDSQAGEEQFETALRLEPDLARAHYSVGVLMVSRGRYQQALQHLSAAVRSDSNYVDARMLLGELRRHTGHLDEALRQYAEVIKIDAGRADAQLGYALTLVASGQYRQARDHLADATAAHPDQPDLVQALARILAAAPDARIRDGNRAVALMQPLVKEHATPELAETMAMAYAETGDFRQAVAWEREALAAAEQTARDRYVQQAMTENLRLFERGEAARVPWRDGTMP